jgi:6,7-dimethyl-8-ribityllumazine synthase
VDALVDGAKSALVKGGIKEANVSVIAAPGSFEIPLFAQSAIQDLKVHAVIAFGVVVQGETHHASLIAESAARGIMDLQLRTGTPIAFEILFVHRLEDARKRSMGLHAKGPLAAATVLSSLAKLDEMRR